MTDKFVIYSGLGGPLGYTIDKLYKGNRNLLGFRSHQCDLLNFQNTLKFFDDNTSKIQGTEKVYLHLAAVSGGSHFSEMIPATIFKKNILMAINALEVCRLQNISRVILVISTSSYGSELENQSEADLHTSPILTPDFGYSYAKRMLDIMMRSYNKEFNMKISCVLVNGIIGENMCFDDTRSLLPAALIKKFVDQKDNGLSIELWGDGTPVREYTSAKDLAKIILWCASNQEVNTLLNIGSPQSLSVADLAVKIADIVGIEKSRFYFNGNVANRKKNQTTNNLNFLKQNSFKYENIEIAIEEAVQFYIHNKQTK